MSEDAAEVHVSRWDGHHRRAAGSLYPRVRDAAAARELRQREDAGKELVPLSGFEDKPWGMREFGIIDPAGWLVRVGSFIT